jgi:hypothetical protein
MGSQTSGSKSQKTSETVVGQETAPIYQSRGNRMDSIALKAKYPSVFSGRCDVSVGAGWVPLLDELCAKLEPLCQDPCTHAVQIKEKFGGLRFYLSRGCREVYDLIAEAEKKAAKTCEKCGEPGAPRSGSWIKTLCDFHSEGREIIDWSNW